MSANRVINQSSISIQNYESSHHLPGYRLQLEGRVNLLTDELGILILPRRCNSISFCVTENAVSFLLIVQEPRYSADNSAIVHSPEILRYSNKAKQQGPSEDQVRRVCHGSLQERMPSAIKLTEFVWCISVSRLEATILLVWCILFNCE